MATMTLTSKGQMTLPKDIRDDLQLAAGDKIDIVKQGGVYVLRPRRSALELVGKYAKKGQKPFAASDLDAAISLAVNERYEHSLDRD